MAVEVVVLEFAVEFVLVVAFALLVLLLGCALRYLIALVAGASCKSRCRLELVLLFVNCNHLSNVSGYGVVRCS